VFVEPLTVAENCAVVPTCKEALVGEMETETVGAGCDEAPTPLSAIEAFAAAVPVTVKVPEALPTALGLNATASCKDPDGESVVWPFQPETTKAELLTLRDCRVTVLPLVLVSVTDCEELVVPTVWLANESDVGLAERRFEPAAQAGIANETIETRATKMKSAWVVTSGNLGAAWNRESFAFRFAELISRNGRIVMLVTTPVHQPCTGTASCAKCE